MPRPIQAIYVNSGTFEASKTLLILSTDEAGKRRL
jgi:hypothetical protein